jgi:carbonic anhydrase
MLAGKRLQAGVIFTKQLGCSDQQVAYRRIVRLEDGDQFVSNSVSEIVD